jgi:hypothetical protein
MCLKVIYQEAGGEPAVKAFRLFWILAFCGGLLLISEAETQTVEQDSTKKQASMEAASSMDSSGEMILDVIEIKGKVEKPGVIIMPKRVEPELTDVELKRSFKKEVEEGSGDILKPDKELGSVDRIKSIKKTVERKRK